MKEEILEKDKRISEYEEKIVQYKTQIRQQQWTPPGTVMDTTLQARIKNLEQTLGDQDRDLLAKDVSLKTLEKDKDKAELKAETLETKLMEKEQQLQDLKTKVEECNKSIAELQLELTKKGKKSISGLRLKLTEVKTQADAHMDKCHRDTHNDQEVSALEQQLKKIIIQLQDDNATVNAKQLKIVELTEQLELAKIEVSYNCKYFILLVSCSSF